MASLKTWIGNKFPVFRAAPVGEAGSHPSSTGLVHRKFGDKANGYGDHGKCDACGVWSAACCQSRADG